MRKSLMSLLLILTLLCSVIPFGVFADVMQIAFPDLPSNHWAYNYVMTLVADGTVRGDETGHFNPSNSVTRAEFVKMVGKGNTSFSTDFTDVPPTHWAYEYVMWSGMKITGTEFLPSQPITRGEIVTLLHSRAGSPVVDAPTVITSQMSRNRNAIAWAYTYALMQGDDGLNLRVNDTVTRAEAAALIIRARGITETSAKSSFPNIVSDELLAYAFNSLSLFDFEYSPDKTITNGELAKAGLRLASDSQSVDYSRYAVKTPFEHQYATDIYLMGTMCTGGENINLEYCNKPANRKDALAFLTYAVLDKTDKTDLVNYYDSYYDDLPKLEKTKLNTMLTWAYVNGVMLEADKTLNPDKAITCREIAAILLQLDEASSGLGSAVTSTLNDKKTAYNKINYRIAKQPSLFPATAKNFRYIINDLPEQLYTTPFEIVKQENETGIPNCNEIYDFARDFAPMFVAQLNNLANKLKTERGMDVEFTYYPTLAAKCSIGFVYRIRVSVSRTSSAEYKYNDVFAGNINKDVDYTFKPGAIFYCDVVTPNDFSQVQFGQVIDISSQE